MTEAPAANDCQSAELSALIFGKCIRDEKGAGMRENMAVILGKHGGAPVWKFGVRLNPQGF